MDRGVWAADSRRRSQLTVHHGIVYNYNVMRDRRPALLLFLLVTCPPASFAADYYVAPGGSNAGPGSFAQPWETIQHAANTAQAGDVVHVRAGNYPENVNLPHSGAPGAYIVFQNYDGEYVTLDPGSFSAWSQSYIRVRRLSHSEYGRRDTGHRVLRQRRLRRDRQQRSNGRQCDEHGGGSCRWHHA